MSAMHIAAWSLAWTFAILLVIACGGNRHLARELRNERAARKVADAAYWAECRAHDKTKRDIRAAFDPLSERRAGIERDLARVHQLDHYRPSDWTGDGA